MPRSTDQPYYASNTNPSATIEDTYANRFRNYHFFDSVQQEIEVTDYGLEEAAEQFRRHLIKVFGNANLDTNTVKVNRKTIQVELDDVCVTEALQALDNLIAKKHSQKNSIFKDISFTARNSMNAPSNRLEQYQQHVDYLNKPIPHVDKEIANLEKLKQRLLVKHEVMEVLTFEKKVFNQCYNLIHDRLTAEYEVLEYYPSLYRSKKEKNTGFLVNSKS